MCCYIRPVSIASYKSALTYAIRAQTIYDVHAPKAFSFLGEVVEDERHFYWFDLIERLRQQYYADKRTLTLTDHGAGSLTSSQAQRKICDIARTSGTSPRMGEYLLKVMDWVDAKRVIELGTNLGLGTAYLAAGLQRDASLISIDADANVQEEARRMLARLPIQGDLRLVKGTFKNTLQPALTALGQVDLAFIDGHHEEQATQDYFTSIQNYTHSNSVVILDDIHWSTGMENAWAWVKQQPGVTMTIDLFRWGVVFFDTSVVEPQHYRIVPWRWKPWHMGFFSSRVNA